MIKLALAAANSVRALCAAACVSRAWRQVTRDPSLWRVLDSHSLARRLAHRLTVPRLKFLLSTGGVEELRLGRERAWQLTGHDVADALEGAPPLWVLCVSGLKAGRRFDATGSRGDPVRRLRKLLALRQLDVRGTCVFGDCGRLCDKHERHCAPCNLFCCDSCVKKCRPVHVMPSCDHICRTCWTQPEVGEYLFPCTLCDSEGFCPECLDSFLVDGKDYCKECIEMRAEEIEREQTLEMQKISRENKAEDAKFLKAQKVYQAREARKRLDEIKQQVEPVAKRAEAAEARLQDALASATVASAAAAGREASLTAEAEAANAKVERLRASLTAEVEAAKAEAARLQARVAELEHEARNEARGKRNAVAHMEDVIQVKREQATAAVAASARTAAALDTATACAICLDKPRQMAVMPCSHLVLCQGCSADMMQHAEDAQGIAARRTKTQPTPPCPICRTLVTGITGPYILS